MDTARLPLELRSIEKLREQELEEARIIQNVMLPAHPSHAGSVTISHEFQPAADVGGDYLDYFRLSDATLAVSRRRFRQGASRRALRGAGCGHATRRTQDRPGSRATHGATRARRFLT